MSIRLGTLALTAVFAASAALAQPAGKTYTLEATPTTVAWGNYDATTKPVLTIKSGDIVVFHTCSPTARGPGAQRRSRPTRSRRPCARFTTRSRPPPAAPAATS